MARVEADDVFDLLLDAVGFGRRQVDLVEDGDEFEIVLDGEICVGKRLGLDALRGVDDEQRAFAGGQRPRNLVRKIDVARACRSDSERIFCRPSPCNRAGRRGP